VRGHSTGSTTASPALSPWKKRGDGPLIYCYLQNKDRVRLEGFEPPTRGLGNRVGSFILVLGCSRIRLSKLNSHIWGCSSFTVVSGGLVYQLVYSGTHRVPFLWRIFTVIWEVNIPEDRCHIRVACRGGR
jgi:hypothetical protein